MSTFEYLKSRATADRLIKRFGMRASLRRAGEPDRDCWVLISSYQPHDQAAALTNPTDRRVIMSADGLDDEPPSNEKDQLVTYVQPPTSSPVVKEVLPFTCPVKPLAPAGIVVFYEFTVRR